ncbi:MAG: hypothetical protein Q4B01_03955 [Eubacteriales bacterium]|nr:hypothetical protein [Eubacteriales bacterium]
MTLMVKNIRELVRFWHKAGLIDDKTEVTIVKTDNYNGEPSPVKEMLVVNKGRWNDESVWNCPESEVLKYAWTKEKGVAILICQE